MVLLVEVLIKEVLIKEALIKEVTRHRTNFLVTKRLEWKNQKEEKTSHVR